MKLFIRTKFLAAAALALGAFGAMSTAHARSDVYFSVGVQTAPGVYVEPAPVYVQPPVYAAPTEVYVRRGPPAYEYRYEDERAWRRAEWRHRYWRHNHHGWDQYQSRGRAWD